MEKLITSDEVCNIIHVSRSWISTNRGLGIGPPYIRIGKRCMYRKEDVTKWLENKAKDNTVNKEKLLLPEWTANLPNHTILIGREVKAIFNIPSSVSIQEAQSGGLVPYDKKISYYSRKGKARKWSLGSVREFVALRNSLLIATNPQQN